MTLESWKSSLETGCFFVRGKCGLVVDIHVENPMKPVDELGITREKRLPQKEK